MSIDNTPTLDVTDTRRCCCSVNFTLFAQR